MIFCDGVGTHLGYHVVKKAIALGTEILLRALHLSCVLQGEDTVNFNVKYMHVCMLVVVDVDVVIVVDDVVVAAASLTDDVNYASVANAHANDDDDDACSDVVAFA